MEIAAKPLIMVSEISGLEPLHGFIKQEKQSCSGSLSVRKEARQTTGVHRAQIAGDCGQAVTANAGSSRRAMGHVWALSTVKEVLTPEEISLRLRGFANQLKGQMS